MIFKFQPFATDKNLGEEYNRHCSLVPSDEDWIMILDYDAMILHTKTYQVIENAISNNPGTKIFGAMTNRIGLSQQRIGKEPDKNADFLHHYRISEKLANEYPNGECKPAMVVGGFFLLFPKSYWLQNPFQQKVITNGVSFDFAFCEPARKQNGIRIIKGAYLWHSYRLWKGSSWADRSHLI